MSDLVSSCSRGAGGNSRPPRSAFRSRHAAALLLLVSLSSASAATAAQAPHLRALLKAARTAVAGSVTGSTSYDEDRVAVVDLTATAVFKGKPGDPPVKLSIVELHEGSNTPPLTAGMRGLAFLRSAPLTSYLARTIPAGSYEQLVPEYGAFVAATDDADAARQLAIMRRVVSIAGGARLPAAETRQLTFDLLASGSPVLVEDGAAGLADLGRDATLTDAESSTLRAALLRTALSDRVRIALIDAVGDAHLTAMVPTLKEIASPPPVMAAAWRALDALGAGASEDEMKERLASTEASTRTAAAREMLQRSGVDAVQTVAPLAVKDSDPQVRIDVIEALTVLKDPATLPVFEQAFVDPSEPQRQAAARGIRAVGGPQAAVTLGRLAETGDIQSQRYAVLILMTLEEPSAAPILERLAKSHPDAKTRDLIEHGFPVHHH